jgi:hypothetical protein
MMLARFSPPNDAPHPPSVHHFGQQEPPSRQKLPAEEDLSFGQKAMILAVVFSIFTGGSLYLANWSVQTAQSAKLTQASKSATAQLALEPPPKPTVWSYHPKGLSLTPTGLGVPQVNVRWRMAQLAYQAHLDKKPTPYNMGSYGCAAAAWSHVIRPALLAAYPGSGHLLPVVVTHTQQIRNFYNKYRLGKTYTVPVFDLTPEKTPPGSVVIGVKQGSGDEHMLIAVEVDWGSAHNPNTDSEVKAGLDGVTDAYAGNTGLPKFGSPHFRIQEFSPTLGFLNTHHGAINSLNPNNYYDHFIVFTFDS